jgi:hypothetical protein
MLAALLVAAVPFAAAKVAIIVAVAFAYMTRRHTLNHALAIGATWLVLAVVVELVMSTHLHHAWSELLGSPAHPAIRVVLLLTWVAAPALFARESAVDAAHRPADR